MMTDAPSPLRKTPLKPTLSNINKNTIQQPQPQPKPQTQTQTQWHQQPQQQRHINNYDKKTKQDMVFLRRQKLKEQLDEEMEEYKFEMVSRNKANYRQITDKSVNMQPQSNYQYQQIPNKQNTPLKKNNPSIDPISMMNDNQPIYDPEPQPMIMMNNYNKIPQLGQIGRNEFDVNRELDYAIKKYADNLDKLKVDEFMSRKKIQDDLLKKINTKLTKINHEINDKVYQENVAEQWMSKYSTQGNGEDQKLLSYDNNHTMQQYNPYN